MEKNQNYSKKLFHYTALFLVAAHLSSCVSVPGNQEAQLIAGFNDKGGLNLASNTTAAPTNAPTQVSSYQDDGPCGGNETVKKASSLAAKYPNGSTMCRFYTPEEYASDEPDKERMIILITAEWCSPCQNFKANFYNELNSLSEQYKAAVYVYFDTTKPGWGAPAQSYMNGIPAKWFGFHYSSANSNYFTGAMDFQYFPTLVILRRDGSVVDEFFSPPALTDNQSKQALINFITDKLTKL